MAEAIVGPLVSKLQELVLSEGKALVAVSGDILRLRDKLMWLLAFLQEAEPSLRARGGELTRLLVRQTRDAAFSAEDAIDEYSVRVDLSRYPGWSLPALGFLAGVTTQLRVRRNLSGKIAAINARLEEIVSNKRTYRLEDPASVLSVKTWTASAASLSESNLWDMKAPGKCLIKREEQESKLEEMLRSPTTGLTVIYVVGESGVGKTTLVNTVIYDSKSTIREHFEVSAVVKVQNNASVQNILRMICDVLKKTGTDQGQDLLEQQVEANTETNQVQEHEGAELKRRLDGKRYLVVIDGRKMAVAVWKAVIHALPKGETSSRVVMITKKVLRSLCKIPGCEVKEIKLKGLLYNDCKMMFQKRLGITEKHEEEDRKTYYERVHRVTGGSPLAVILLSGLMHDKEYPHEWDSVLGHLMSAKSKLLDRVLSMSFEDLHHELKLCFLYFSAFPESYTVDDDTLVKLWVAEGFLAPRYGKTAEQVGHTYVRQLVTRGLVDSACRHHLTLKERVYHFARSEAQEASFMELHDGDNVPEPATVRRLTLLSTMDRYVALDNCMPKLRSIIAIDEEKPVSTAWYQSCLCQPQLSPSSGPAAGRGSSGSREAVSVLGSSGWTGFFSCWTGFFSGWTASGPVEGSANLTKLLQGSKFLRVIMLEGPGIGTELPEAIGSMVHLRYLGVRCQSLKTIPTSIGNLHNLQTMDVASSSVEELPESFWKIKSLRHVTGHQLRMPRRVGELKQLQTLSSVRICRDFQILDLKRMVNLRTLDMIFEGALKEAAANEFPDCLKTINKLTHLKLEGSGLLMSIFTSPSLQSLQIMCLVGTVQKKHQLHTTPSSEHFQLPNLFRLSLKGTQLQKCFIERLGELPRLGHLIFEEVSIFDEVSNEEQELVFLPEGFRRSQKLTIDNKPSSVRIDEHAQPVGRCSSLCNSSAAVDALNTRCIVVTDIYKKI